MVAWSFSETPGELFGDFATDLAVALEIRCELRLDLPSQEDSSSGSLTLLLKEEAMVLLLPMLPKKPKRCRSDDDLETLVDILAPWLLRLSTFFSSRSWSFRACLWPTRSQSGSAQSTSNILIDVPLGNAWVEGLQYASGSRWSSVSADVERPLKTKSECRKRPRSVTWPIALSSYGFCQIEKERCGCIAPSSLIQMAGRYVVELGRGRTSGEDGSSGMLVEVRYRATLSRLGRMKAEIAVYFEPS